MVQSVKHVAVIGAGPMGLASAYYALKAGHSVSLFERQREPGGMAAHFDFAGISIERFYHFVCKADVPMFDLMRELGMADKICWRPTSMGYFIEGKLYKWGDPISLITFPLLGPIAKLRYALHAFMSTKRSNWAKLDRLEANNWIRAWIGTRAYEMLWRPLFELKFFEYAHNISAAWIWTRMKRVGTSRRSLFQEEMGYVEGGSETLVHALVEAIKKLGGTVQLGFGCDEVVVRDGKVAGVRCGDAVYPADRVISTVPIPYVPAMVPALPREWSEKYQAVPNIGVVCVLFRLRKSVTPNFWVNISDKRIDIPGFVEFSNLRPLPDTVVYVPYYMPQNHPKFTRDDSMFVNEAYAYLRLVNPALTETDLIASHVGRLRYAQPVCKPGFLAELPPVQTSIAGLQIADTCFYYPEDRGISESVRFARNMVANLS
jgi:protoporphyrinogen oxidase